MQGRGRPAQPPKRSAGSRAGASARSESRAKLARLREWRDAVGRAPVGFGRALHRFAAKVGAWTPRRAGVLASCLFLLVTAGYGIHRGGHLAAFGEALIDFRDQVANAAGFRIATLSITGRKQMGDENILAAAGITARTSLLFLDVDATRRRLEATPWIAQASVRKLYPGNLEIAIEERAAFALWQHGGTLAVIASDGTVLGPVGERRVATLPLVVGPGAAAKARDFLTVVDRYPAIREQVRASVLVADRRWNLKLKNGLDIRLPEADVARALDLLVALDRDKKLLTRDLTAIDLRLPERVTVRLSDEAAQAREQAVKDAKKRKGV